MNRRLTFKREAEADVDETYLWYKERSSRVGSRFLRAVDATLANIERNPFAYQIVLRSARRATLRRFPYSIYFVIRESDIVITACVHGHRDPAVWQNRL